ncbi:MAG: ABC transporter permease [bacterium]
MEALLHDLKYTLRSLGRSPGFAAVAILSLALGIGVNSAVFSLYNALFIRQLPVEEPGELVNVYTSDEEMEHSTFSYPDYVDVREQTGDVFTDVLVTNVSLGIMDRGAGSQGEYLFGETVSGNYWDVLGIAPDLGRPFTASDDEPGSEPVVILGNAMWRSRFGGDPGVVGETIRLNGLPYTVVGVAPPWYRGTFPLTADYFVPIHTDPANLVFTGQLEQRGSRSLFVKGRLREGVSVAQAAAVLRTVGSRLAQQYPETNEDRTFTAIPSSDVAIMPLVDRPLQLVSLFLMIMVGLTLLVACTNLAGMLLARAASREWEVAVRLALGAGRGRLLRQLLTESTLIGVLGAAAGVGIAAWLLHLLNTLQPPIPIPVNLDIRLDGNVLLFTGFLALFTGLLFGIIPALQGTRPDLVRHLKQQAGSSGRARTSRLRRLLVTGQVAVSALLLVCAGLFVRSLSSAADVDPGFEMEHGVIASLELRMRGYESEEAPEFFRRLRDRVAALPGVESAALTDRMPLGASVQSRWIYPETDVPLPEEGWVSIDSGEAGPDYFETVGVPILAGRPFRETDTEDAPLVTVVNRTFAQRFWPGESALGKQLRRSSDGPTYEIVGIAADGKYRTLGEQPRPYVWFSYRQSSSIFMAVVARPRGASEEAAQALKPEIREAVREMDPELPIFELVTLREHLSIMMFLPRTLAALLSGLGGLALLLGLIGLYGVIAFDVNRRTREIGIRMALGADRDRVLRGVVLDGLRLTLWGTAIGLGAAFLATRSLSALIYGVSTTDPVTFGGVALLLVGVTLAATWGPARRAAHLEPMRALRYE